MKFEHDPKKSVSNKLKHGISLEEAKKLWSKPYLEIEARTLDEPRYMLIGKIEGKFYSRIYTIRNDAIRLISARRSRVSEGKLYYEYIKK